MRSKTSAFQHPCVEAAQPSSVERFAPVDVETARRRAAEAFDRIWRSRPDPRRARARALTWLARKLHLDEEHCRIETFDIETCRRAEQICKSVLPH